MTDDDPPLTTFLDPDLPRRLRALNPHDPDLIRAAALIEDMTPVYRAAEEWASTGIYDGTLPIHRVMEQHEAAKGALQTAVGVFQASNPDTNY